MEADLRKLPPQSIEAEMSVLGGILLDNEVINRVHEIIAAEDFYRENHRKIFNAMVALTDKNMPVDLITLVQKLKESNELEEAGGGAYLATLVDYVPTAANIAYYCRIVQEKSHRRKVISNMQTSIAMAYDDAETLESVIEQAGKISFQTVNQSREPVKVGTILRDVIREIAYRAENTGKLPGISYGITSLDKLTGGMHGGDLIIVAGRPSMGKTAFAMNIVEAAAHENVTCLVFSVEMSGQQLIERSISSQGKIKYHEIRSGEVGNNYGGWEKIAQAAGKIHEWPLYIDDTPGITFRAVQSKARKLKKSGLGLIVVDYLQLMGLPGKDNRNREIGDVTRGFKNLARELGIPVIALSQLNRGVDARPDKRPTMSDLRDCGEIENDADVILFPYRPTVYCQACKDAMDDDKHDLAQHRLKAEIIIGKQRNGPSAETIPLIWIGENQKFYGVMEYGNG